jgi:hypothetical protein
MTAGKLYLKSIILTLVWSFFIGSFCMGQSVKPYYKYEKGDYEDAEEGFRKVLNEFPEDVIANMGLGLLCSNNSILTFPTLKEKYDLFQAFRYIRKSKKGIDKLTDGELMVMDKMVKTIPDMKDKVYKEYDKIEFKLYNHVMSQKNRDSADIFINEFPDSKYFKQVLQIRNNSFFDQVKNTNDVKALNDFIERCPDADSIPTAIRLRNLAAYNAMLINLSNKTRSLEAVYDYLNRYPNSKQYQLVIDLRDKLESENAKQEGTFDAYSYFMEKFPKALQASVLKDKYIELSYYNARKKNTLVSYTEFLDRFPLAKPYSTAVRTNRDSLCFSIFSISVDSLNKFITYFPASKFLESAIRLRNEKAFENSKKENEITAFEQFIYRYPAAIQINEALAIRDSIVLDQVKFLSSEKDFNDFLSHYPYLINRPKTQEILEDVLYKEAKKLDDYEYYFEFINRCPRSKYNKEIQDLLKSKEKPEAK